MDTRQEKVEYGPAHWMPDDEHLEQDYSKCVTGRHLEEGTCVKDKLSTLTPGKTVDGSRLKPSIEWYIHASIYKKLGKEVNAIMHTHSPYTPGIAISTDNLQHVIEEAKLW
jgi:ribulose-5-phosphate 4-epimerase/fuculose-1-phosphate aldolase